MIQKVDKIWMDGKFIPWDEANVHVLTHTLHYGLGVFEGVRCYECEDGRSAVFRLHEHTNRLFESAHISQMKIPYTKEEISEATLEVLRVNGLKEAYIRPLVFIGEGEMGIYVKDYNVRASIAAWPWGAYLGEEGIKKGIRIKISSFTRQHVNISMTKAKVCGNYVNSMMAKREAILAGYDEALLLDNEGYVSEGSGENIFIVKGGVVKTTPCTTVLTGITRDSVMKILADSSITVKEERFTRDELYTADEAFFTGTAAEITPIREVDDRTIGSGSPGETTRKVQDLYFRAVKGKEERYEGWLSYL
ncbi:MAG: branched-chain amino acid transaminase [bacterium]|nr:branched-chain amino acid transaminase [bacterium]